MKRPYSLTARLAAVVILAFATIGKPAALQRRLPGVVRQTSSVDGRLAAAGEVLVKYRRPLAPFERAQLDQQADADETHPVGRSGLRRVHSRRFDTAALLAFLRAHPDVEYAEPNYIITADAVPNDTQFGQLWGMRNTGQIVGVAGTAGADIGATSAWDISTGSRSIVVGIIDTGLDYMHPDFSTATNTNIWTATAPFSVVIAGQTINCPAGTHGFNAITKSCGVTDVWDDNGHGTHIAGTIGAVGNNSRGVAGVNWATTMMASKFLDSTGSGTLADAIDAIDFVIQASQITGANVRVLNNSWSAGGFSQALLDQINIANSRNMLFVASAGNTSPANDNDAAPRYPAGYNAPNVIAVASTDNKDQLATNSNYGATTVHLAAPGVNILSTVPDGIYQYLSGTSMAAPHVAGAAALLLSTCTGLDTAQIKNTLLARVDPIPLLNGKVATGGRLNVNSAIRACMPNFSISATPATQTDSNRTGAAYTATVTPSGGFTGAVNFTVSGLPAAASASFTPTSVAGSGSTQMTVTTGVATPAGVYPLTITGTSGALVHATSVTLTISSASTTTTVASTSNPSVYGSGVTFTATVGGSGTPTGSVTFSDDGAALGSATVDATGHATLTTSTLSAGTHLITAVYFGDSTFAGSTSDVLVQVVNRALLTITASNQTRAYGAANPALTVTYSGFVNGDTATSLTTPPAVTTTATAASPAGTYPITASGAASPNYTITYVPGTLTVTNTAPVADNALVTTVEDTPAIITLHASDAEGTGLTYSILTQPAHGTLSGMAPDVTYTPAPNYNGGDTFTFKANDGMLDSNAATVTIVVTPDVDAPVAAGDSFTISEDMTLIIDAPGVLRNDIDVDRGVMTAILVTPSSHGTLRLDEDGGFVYTPDASYSGPDTFTYKSNNGELDSNLATVTITVQLVNAAPIAADDSVTTTEEAPAAVVLSATDREASPLTYAIVTPPAHGTLSGTAPALIYTPAPNYNGVDWFTYKANDGELDSNLAVVGITIDPINRPPVAADDSYTTDEGVALTVAAPGVLGNDADPDSSAASAKPMVVAWDPSSDENVRGYIVHYGPAPGVYTNAVDVGKTTVWVATGMTAGQEYYFAISSYVSEQLQSVLSGEVTATPTTISVLESSTLSANPVSGPAHGTLTLNANGGFTYSPAANYYGPDLFTYKATDGIANSNVATVNITVGARRALITATPSTVSAGAPISVTVTGASGHRLDWVGLFATNDADTTPPRSWMYMNGVTTPPAAGLASATLSFTAPSKPGTYELRLFASGGLTKLATSNAVAVQASAPTITVTNASVTAGALMTFTVANGPAGRLDWVGLYALADGDASPRAWMYLSGTTTAPSVGVSGATLEATAPPTPGLYEFRLFASGGLTKLATSGTVTVQSAAPTITVSNPIVTAGAPITFTVAGGPASPIDWIGLFALTDADANPRSWMYLNGTMTRPAVGLSAATLQATAPMTPGLYEFRLFASGGLTKLATSGAVTVQSAAPTISVSNPTVAPGQPITFTVAGGPSNRIDWIGLFALTDADASPRAWMYLNGTTTAPAVGVSGATLQATAPLTAGLYELRLFASGGLTKLATSGAITVQGAAATVTVSNGTVATGDAISFTVAGGPANRLDWIGLFALTDGDANPRTWMYLNGTTTAPAVGVSGAILQATAPPTPGLYEFRLFASGGLTKLATSSTVTVQATTTITVSTPVVASGAPIMFTVADGFAHILDWVGLYKPSDGDANPRSWMYLSGTTTPPSTGVSLATLQAAAPLSAGSYELRLFARGGLTRLVTSSAIQVQP